MVKISVIMPVYNVSEYLNKSIESIQNQTMDDIEIVCVDDGSTDDSLGVLENLQEKYSNITIISQDNSGPGGARNNGILHSNGEYIAFLDADDIFLDSEALEKMYFVAKDNNYCPLVCANLRRINQDYSIDEYYDYINSKFNYFLKEDILDVEEYGIPFAFYKNIFNREYLLGNDILFPDYRFGEDPLFMVKVLENINEFPVVPLDLYGYNHSIGGGVNEKINNYTKKHDYIKTYKLIFDILIQKNYQKILSGYKKEFVNYLIYSDNMLDSEIKEITKELFCDFEKYFSEGDYGFFIMDYIINFDSKQGSINYDEFNLIKKCLFEETCIEGNFIGPKRLRNYYKIIEDRYNKEYIRQESYNQICQVKKDFDYIADKSYSEVEQLNDNLKYDVFDKNAEHLKKFLESRIDIKNYGNSYNTIELISCDDELCNMYQPTWFNDDEGIGSVVNSVKGNLKFKFRCINDGTLVINFKSIDYRDKEGNRIPIFIDYTQIKVNDEDLINERVSTWHDEPFVYQKDVVDDEEITVAVSWLPLNISSNIHMQSESESLLSKFLECRIDIKNMGTSKNSLVIMDCDDSSCNISRPAWFKDDLGVGQVINSISGNLNITFKCVQKGNLKFEFKGIDYRDKEDNRIPIFINYTDIVIDGESIIDSNVISWHDEPFIFKKKVDDEQIIKLQVNWLPLNNLNDDNIYTKNDIDYLDNMIQSKNIEINKLEKELKNLNNENIQLKDFKTNVLNSNSWKLTEPLRKLKSNK